MNALKLLLTPLIFSVVLFACKKDNTPAVQGPPVVNLVKDTIISKFGSDFIMEAELRDSAGISSFNLRNDEWYLNNTISLLDSSNPKRYQLRYKFKMPANAANKQHRVTLTVTNIGGMQTNKDYLVTIDADFPKLYLVESKDVALLTKDLFGVPVVTDKKAAYQYEAVYYAEKPQTSVWFAPGKTALAPILYGVDAADNKKLTGDAGSAQPIVLPAAGYYRINLNTLTLEYTVTALPAPNPANAFPQVAIAGQGFYDYPAMAWQNALPNIILLDKDAANPYLFTKLVKLGVPPGQSYTEAQFIFTTNNGWTNFWRFDNGKEPEYTVPNNGANGGGFPITSTPVTYKVTFDTYTNRCRFVKQ